MVGDVGDEITYLVPRFVCFLIWMGVGLIPFYPHNIPAILPSLWVVSQFSNFFAGEIPVFTIVLLISPSIVPVYSHYAPYLIP